MKKTDLLWFGVLLMIVSAPNSLPTTAAAQEMEKIRIGHSGTAINNYLLRLIRNQGIFRRHGLDAEIIYVGSGSLLSQALIAGSFEVAFSQGSEPIVAKLRGADQRIVASVVNRFNHVFMTHPSITSLKQLKGKRETREIEEILEQQALLVRLALRELLVHKELKVRKVHRDRKGQKVTKEIQAKLGLQVL